MLEKGVPEQIAFAAMMCIALTVELPRFLLILHFRTAGRHMRHAGVINDGKEKPDLGALTSIHALFILFTVSANQFMTTDRLRAAAAM